MATGDSIGRRQLCTCNVLSARYFLPVNGGMMSIAHDRGRTQASARVDPLSGLYARPPETKDPKLSAIDSGGAGRAIGIPKREAPW